MIVFSFVFALGLIIGSFLNVVILRLNTGQSFVKDGSRCYGCGARLKWFELIPIVSFIAQKGRCRQCKSRISWQYPLVEFVTGLVFLLVILKISNFSAEGGSASSGQFLSHFLLSTFYFLIFSLLIAISVYDIRHQIIPDKIVYLFIILSFLNLFGIWGIRVSFLGGIILFSFFALLWFVSRGKWMGFGDAKLALGVGWLLGLEKGILALLFSFWIGAIFGLLALAFSKSISPKSKIPFGPFIVSGTLIAFFAGDFFVQFFLASLFG